jgi:KipI family sensor histidine kinase inhibitor
MKISPLGDAAWLVEFPELAGAAALARVTGLRQALAPNRPTGVLDVVSSFESLAVHFGDADGVAIRTWILSTSIEDAQLTGTDYLIPVCYGGCFGPDLIDVAERSGMSPAEVIALHAGATYTVAAIGFTPGFPYLIGLPAALHLPRLATARPEVPAGSVAIAGDQAGIYPSTSPGGWHLLGQTGFQLFDPNRQPASVLQPGDRVKFVPVSQLESAPPPLPSPAAIASPWIEVVSPGALTTVQDLGRFGHESAGVSPGGAMDRQAARLANRLVGNADHAALLELCLSGPVLRFHRETVVAMTTNHGKPRRVSAGETVDFSKFAGGVRACLAVAGGLAVPDVLGSASTDLRGGFGGVQGRPLQTGDWLATVAVGKPWLADGWHVGRTAYNRPNEIELRFIRGTQADWFSSDAERRLRTQIYHLTPHSDRMGARLDGPPLTLAAPREMISQPVAQGSIQVPPDGQPIVLAAARQTIGGYPQIGHVITVDLPRLARAWPGTAIRFREVTWDDAQAFKADEKRDFDWLRTGLELLKFRSCG